MQTLASTAARTSRLAISSTNKNCTFCLTPWSAPAFNAPGQRRTVVPMKEDQCPQSPRLPDALCNMSEETRALGSRTSFNSTPFLKILLVYSSSQTSGWQFPLLLGQCCVRASLTLVPICRRVRQKG